MAPPVDAGNCGQRAIALANTTIEISELLRSKAEDVRRRMQAVGEDDPSGLLTLAQELRKVLTDCLDKNVKKVTNKLTGLVVDLKQADYDKKKKEAALKESERKRLATITVDSDEDDDFVSGPLPNQSGTHKQEILERYLEEQAEIVATSPMKTVVTVREPSPVRSAPTMDSASPVHDSFPTSEATSKRLKFDNSGEQTTLETSYEFPNSLESSAGGFVPQSSKERESCDKEDDEEGVEQEVDGEQDERSLQGMAVSSLNGPESTSAKGGKRSEKIRRKKKSRIVSSEEESDDEAGNMEDRDTQRKSTLQKEDVKKVPKGRRSGGNPGKGNEGDQGISGKNAPQEDSEEEASSVVQKTANKQRKEAVEKAGTRVRSTATSDVESDAIEANFVKAGRVVVKEGGDGVESSTKAVKQKENSSASKKASNRKGRILSSEEESDESEVDPIVGAAKASDEKLEAVKDTAEAQVTKTPDKDDVEAHLTRTIRRILAEDSASDGDSLPKTPEVRKPRRRITVDSDEDDEEAVGKAAGPSRELEVNKSGKRNAPECEENSSVGNKSAEVDSQATTVLLSQPNSYQEGIDDGMPPVDVNITPAQKKTSEPESKKKEPDDPEAALKNQVFADLDEISLSSESAETVPPCSEVSSAGTSTKPKKMSVRVKRCKIPNSVCRNVSVNLQKLPENVLEEVRKSQTISLPDWPELLGKKERRTRKQPSSDEEDAEIRRLLRPVRLGRGKRKVKESEQSSEEQESGEDESDEEEVKPKRAPRPKKKPEPKKSSVKEPSSSSDEDYADESSDDDDDADQSSDDDSAVAERKWAPSLPPSMSSEDPDRDEVMAMLDEMSEEEEEKDEGVGSDGSKSKEEDKEKAGKKDAEKRKRRRAATSEDSDENTDSNKENEDEEASTTSERRATKKPRSDAARQVDAVLARVRLDGLSSDEEPVAVMSERERRKRRNDEMKQLRQQREVKASPGNKRRRIVINSSSEDETDGKEKKENIIEEYSDTEVEEVEVEDEEDVVDLSSDSDFMTPEQQKAEKKKAPRRRRKVFSSDDDDDDEEEARDFVSPVAGGPDGDSSQTPSKGRKNIKKIIKEKDLNIDTQEVMKEEKERVKRLEAKEKVLEEIQISSSSGEDDEEEQNGEEEGDGQEKDKMAKKFVLDVDPETKKPTVLVHKKLNEILKPHQRQGIKFMFDTTVESLKQVKEGNKGGGGILAHCMGLGKTLQIVTLIHTLVTHKELGFKKFLVLCPKNTVLNWAQEFKKWLDYKGIGTAVDVYRLDDKPSQPGDRVRRVKHWYRSNGVFIMSYSEFGPMADPEHKTWKRFKETLQECLVDPGPDFVICDEGHLLKNENTKCFKAMAPVKTRRRLMLTGTPLQNNLEEYHSMVQLVKPNLLGTKKEFMNRFGNPILNGSHIDSSPHDFAVMRKRSYILHKKLEPIVQRKSYAVLLPYLPQKLEYVINVKLTPLQANLYRGFLNQIAVEGGVGGKGTNTRQRLLEHFHMFTRVWNHPALLTMNRDDKPKKPASDDEMRDFIVDGSSDEERTSGAKKGKKKKNGKGHEDDDSADEDLNVDASWWTDILDKDDDIEKIEHAGKFILFLDILMHCQNLGEKLVLFTSSRLTLNFLELVLKEVSETRRAEMKKGAKVPSQKTGFIKPEKEPRWENYVVEMGAWRPKCDYHRIDGSTSKEDRSNIIRSFNNPKSPARLLVVTTKAGGIGVNMVGANRAILMDVNWNPANDVQALYRIFRLGQKKEVFVYRLVAAGCMEEKIYSRCVSKLSLSSRVVDEHQIKRHYSSNDLHELYVFDSPPSLAEADTIPTLPKDTLLADILRQRKEFITGYHDHDSLLENRVEESLDEEEKKRAWEEYDADHKRGMRPPLIANAPGLLPVPQLPSYWNPKTPEEALRLVVDYQNGAAVDGSRVRMIHTAFTAANAKYPNASPAEQTQYAAGLIADYFGRSSLGAAPAQQVYQPAPMPSAPRAGSAFGGLRTAAPPQPHPSTFRAAPGPSNLPVLASPRFSSGQFAPPSRWTPPARVYSRQEPVTIRVRPPSRPVPTPRQEVIDLDE